MTQPFWRWTGWLSLGLAGCLQADARKPFVRSVSVDRPGSREIVPVSEQRAYSRILRPTPASGIKTVSATSDESTKSPSEGIGLATYQVAIPGPNMGSSKSLPDDCPSCSRDGCAAPRSANGNEIPFVPVAVPAAELPATDQRPAPPPMTITPYRPPVAWQGEEPRPFHAATPAIPVSQSASARETVKPMLDEDFFPEDHEPSVKSPVRQASSGKSVDTPFDDLDQPASLPRREKQESLEVVNQISETDAVVAAAVPHDVAVLVDQVFEDLRQSRLSQARQRTEWLKQLVARRANERESAQPNADADSASDSVGSSEAENFFEDQK